MTQQIFAHDDLQFILPVYLRSELQGEKLIQINLISRIFPLA